MSFVLDSSIALTWCFEDEASSATDALLDRLTDEGAYASSLWPLEVLNVLAMAHRRGRITAEARQERTSFLQRLPIMLDAETTAQAWTMTNRLSDRHGLTLYDATYLELAQRLEVPLATLDADLRQAASNLGIALLGKPGDSKIR